MFRSLIGRCRGNRLFLVLSTELMDVAGCRRLVAQPGGLTLGFAVHLVNFYASAADPVVHGGMMSSTCSLVCACVRASILSTACRRLLVLVFGST